MYKKETDSNIEYNIAEINSIKDLSNPMNELALDSINLENYEQVLVRPKYDSDYFKILDEVNSVNNVVPQKLPVYNFNINEINGEYYYNTDGTVSLIREYDSDSVRDYYVRASDNAKIEKIIEYDKNTLQLRTKIEPIIREGSHICSNITLFDSKINNKYILIQLTTDGTVNNITEFNDSGKNFKTVYRDYGSTRVVKYISGKETKEAGFVMLNCIFDKEGKIINIKKYSNKKDVIIAYDNNKKNICTKNKL